MKTTPPYISFVVAGRNDNYGGGFVVRMNIFIKTLAAFCEKYRLDSELVIVEWNPPENNPPLKEALYAPENLQYCEIRIIKVPAVLHKQLPGSDKLPLFEYIGKNTGIRRARGEYILITNPDIIFSESLIRLLSRRNLSPGSFYRIGRYDSKSFETTELSAEKAEEYCEGNVIRRHHYWHSDDGKFQPTRFLKDFARYLILRAMHFPFAYPFATVAGDFFLMHKDSWHKLHGCPEKENNYFIDGYICYMAVTAGLKQKILGGRGIRIYHQEHGGRREADASAVQEYRRIRKKMLKDKKPIIFNNEDWGLGRENLDEFVVGSP